MPNNSPEQTRKKLYEAYEDSLFQLVMHDAAEKEGRLFLEEKEKLKNDPEFMLSQDAVEKFGKQLDVRLLKDNPLEVLPQKPDMTSELLRNMRKNLMAEPLLIRLCLPR